MKNAIIIHGTYGSPNENWFPWLKENLENIGYQVFVPSFPTPENQNLESWLEVIGKISNNIGPETIMVGHSLGVSFILLYAELLNLPIKAIFLVSGFLGLLGNDEYDNLNKDFSTRKFDWEKIKRNVGKIYLYHSDNDPYIPLENADNLAKNLGINLEIIQGAGHFNNASGYVSFPKLLSDIENLEN